MFLFLIYLSYILAIAYALLLFSILYSWKKRRPLSAQKASSSPLITVLIPARNEEKNILACIRSVLKQDYPTDQIEVIVIDDHSTDNTAHLVRQLGDQRVRLLRLADYLKKDDVIQAYKKAALSLGVKQSKGTYIVTTDADCQMPTSWLKSYASAFQDGKEMVLAPVAISGSNNFLTAFQGLDVAGTMLLTGGAVFWRRPILSNGANFGFSKQFFHTLGGYSGNENQASGDDIFLLQKAVQKNVTAISFLPTPKALVQTTACQSWNALFWQRLRWASKTTAYRDLYLIGFQAGVFLFCVLLWGISLAFLLGHVSWVTALFLWGLKAFTDIFYLHYATKKLGSTSWLWWFLPAFAGHSLYIVFIGLLAFLPISIRWKERS